MGQQGNITFGSISPGGGGGGTVTGADNGVSLSGTNVVLGQDVSEAGSPGELISIREIPLNGYQVNFPLAGDSWMHITGGESALEFYTGNTAVQPITIYTKQGLDPTGTQPYGNFQIGWIDQGYTNPDGQIDAVMTSGYNTNGSDGRINPNEAAFATVLESHFIQGAAPDGGFEWYLTSFAKNSQINRHMFLVVNKDNGSATLDLTIDSFEITETIIGGGQTYCSIGSNGQLKLTGASPQIQFTTPTPAADGQLTITSSVGSGGTTVIANPSTGASNWIQINNSLLVRSATVVNGYTKYWFESLAASGDTRMLSAFNLNTNSGQSLWSVWDNGNVSSLYNAYFGEDLGTATARVHAIGSAAGAAGTSSVKLGAGTLLTIPEDGALEYDGTHLYFTIGIIRHTLI